MTFERFKQLWSEAGLNDRPPVKNPIMIDEMSPHTIDALVAAAHGDFTAFERVEKLLGT